MWRFQLSLPYALWKFVPECRKSISEESVSGLFCVRGIEHDLSGTVQAHWWTLLGVTDCSSVHVHILIWNKPWHYARWQPMVQASQAWHSSNHSPGGVLVLWINFCRLRAGIEVSVQGIDCSDKQGHYLLPLLFQRAVVTWNRPQHCCGHTTTSPTTSTSCGSCSVPWSLWTWVWSTPRSW